MNIDIKYMRDYPTLHLETSGSKGKIFYCCSTFHSHNTIYNKEDNTFPKMGVTRVRPAIEWYSLLLAQLYTPITSEEDMCPDVAFTAESKEYHSIAGLTRVTPILGNVLSSLL
jgi:hypothetical protein